LNALLNPKIARHRTPVELAPDLEWLDRVTGRAAVDPAYRELLLARPSTALIGESLPVGLASALGKIRARDLSEYARLAIETEVAYRVLGRAGRLEDLLEVRDPTGPEPVGAAA
jgi:hypothetical protein